jgi:hypothetical protein
MMNLCNIFVTDLLVGRYTLTGQFKEIVEVMM